MGYVYESEKQWEIWQNMMVDQVNHPIVFPKYKHLQLLREKTW